MTLKNLFRTTQYDAQDARQIANKSKEFIESKYGIKVKIKKESDNSWYGGSVSGGKTRSITLFIQSKETFDLIDFMNELKQCTFTYEENQVETAWVPSIQNYIINIEINGKQVERDRIVMGVPITDEMLLRYVFNDEYYENTINDYYFQELQDNGFNKWVLKQQ